MTLEKIFKIAKFQLFPINRSLTGKGTKKTLKIIKNQFNFLKIKKIKSGKKIYDWKIPEEWNVEDAYVKDKYEKKIINFKNNSLHLVGYSQPINKKINKDLLLKKIYSLPKQPNAIPYVTSYYKKNWGFCISEKQLNLIRKTYNKEDKFNVVIKSNFKKNGFLHYGEALIKGKSKQEILISTYICHPSMANNELSGPIVSMGLMNYFMKKKPKKTLRFLFIPETIGSIAYIKKNFKKLKKNVIGGFLLTCIGDNKNHSFMLSKYKNSPSDEALLEAYAKLKIKKKIEYSFLKRGSDERQFNSPGIDLGITSIFRSKYNTFPEYHTSLDDFNFVNYSGVLGGFQVAKQAINNLQKKIFPKSKLICEPFLTKRNLYSTISKKDLNSNYAKKILDFLQFADGKNSLEKISILTSMKLSEINKLTKMLIRLRLITF